MSDAKPEYIYVAGPYSAATEDEILANCSKAIEIGMELFRMGHYPFIPHLNYMIDKMAAKRGVSIDYESWMAWDRPWVERCDSFFLVAPSPGANRELVQALKLGRKVYMDIGDVPVVRGA